jgi:hypothetical protein
MTIDRLNLHLAQIQHGYQWYIQYELQELQACSEVGQHLVQGEDGCPIQIYCSNCSKFDKCNFIRTYRGTSEPKSPLEFHVDLFNKWTLLRILKMLSEYVEELKREVSSREG